MFARLVIIALGLFGALTFGQGPEIANQYQQRIGGALSELETVIRQFDADAVKNGLSREEALQTYEKSSEPFLKDRGRSMATALNRFENLTAQASAFNTSSDLLKPVVLMTHRDDQIFKGVLEDYSFGLPINISGLLYSVFGALIGAILGLGFKAATALDTMPSKIRIEK